MHIPVLLKEVIQFLDPAPGKKYIDATVGMGGHAKEIAKLGGKVLGIDRDPSAIHNSLQLPLTLRGRVPSLKVREGEGELLLVQGNFRDIKELAQREGFAEVDGILFDLGLGSHQLDDPARGFSFQHEGPLDMRYNSSLPVPQAGLPPLTLRGGAPSLKIREGRGELLTAREIVNTYSEKELVRIFYEFGEEKRFGKKIARAIMEARKTGTIETTTALFELIKKALPPKFRFRAGDTARRIFQALRIEVNQELENLEKALPQALGLLKGSKGEKGGGRLVVISFHSLEDRIVKRFFQREARDCVCPPEFPVCRCAAEASLRILTKKPIRASPEEVEKNRRAQPAKLRAAQKL